MEPLFKPSEPKKITPKTLISSYYKPTRKRPSEQPFIEPAIKYVQDERQRNNEDFKDKQLFDKLSAEYKNLKESSNDKITQEKKQAVNPHQVSKPLNT